MYSQPISKFITPFESYENVDCTVHDDLIEVEEMLNNPNFYGVFTKLVSVCNAIQTIPLRYLYGAISLSHRQIFFFFYSQPIPKFNMPCES